MFGCWGNYPRGRLYKEVVHMECQGGRAIYRGTIYGVPNTDSPLELSLAPCRLLRLSWTVAPLFVLHGVVLASRSSSTASTHATNGLTDTVYFLLVGVVHSAGSTGWGSRIRTMHIHVQKFCQRMYDMGHRNGCA